MGLKGFLQVCPICKFGTIFYKVPTTDEKCGIVIPMSFVCDLPDDLWENREIPIDHLR